MTFSFGGATAYLNATSTNGFVGSCTVAYPITTMVSQHKIDHEIEFVMLNADAAQTEGLTHYSHTLPASAPFSIDLISSFIQEGSKNCHVKFSLSHKPSLRNIDHVPLEKFELVFSSRDASDSKVVDDGIIDLLQLSCEISIQDPTALVPPA